MGNRVSKQFRTRGFHWLVCLVTLGFVNYLTSGTALATPNPTITFEALEETGVGNFPPDTNGAVSRSFVMTALNSEILIQQKDNQIVNRFDLDEFLGYVDGPGS